MTDEDFKTEMGSIISYNKDEIISSVLGLVRKKLEDAPPPNFAEIAQEIEKSHLIHQHMLAWMHRWVANEVGNRLRCGIWDGTSVDRLFDSIWTEQFDVAIKDRIRQRVYSAIDAVIKERVTSIFV